MKRWRLIEICEGRKRTAPIANDFGTGHEVDDFYFLLSDLAVIDHSFLDIPFFFSLFFLHSFYVSECCKTTWIAALIPMRRSMKAVPGR